MMTEADKELERDWQRLLYKIKPLFKRKPNLQTMLFLIGVQELGQLDREYSKEEKQDLMHIAVCTLLGQDGFYVPDGMDQDGWPHFIKTTKQQPEGLEAQEKLLKQNILKYFQNQTN